MDIIYDFYIPLFFGIIFLVAYLIFIKKTAESEEIKKRLGNKPKWVLICSLALLFLAMWNFPIK